MVYQRTLDGSVLLPLLRRVFDPGGTGTPRGPLGTTPEDIVALLRSRYEAIIHLDEIDDSTFEWARFVYLTSWQRYLRERPRFAADPDLGKLHAAPDLEWLLNHACVDLIALLGMSRERFADTLVGRLEHPATWREKHLRTTIELTEVTPSGVNVALQVNAGTASATPLPADSPGVAPKSAEQHVSEQEDVDAQSTS